jgi:hypothetical protein
MSDAFDVTVLGIEAAPRASSFTLYPDPHDGVFIVEGAAAGASEATIRVTDLLGKTRTEYRARAIDGRFKQVVDITNAPSGVYLVQVSAGKFERIMKILKK